MAGYSKRTLVEKLGIKPGHTLLIVNAPAGYTRTLGDLPAGVQQKRAPQGRLDVIHLFVVKRANLERDFPKLKKHLATNGMLWVSWPKGKSKIATDLNENIIREVGLGHGLVDVKVAAIDDDWSGLKFVYRLKDRA